MVRRSISQRTARRIVLALIVIAVGLEQYQWLAASQLPAFEQSAEQVSVSGCCELLHERERYTNVLKRSPFTLDTPVETIDLLITIYGSVKYSGENKLVIRFESEMPSQLMSVGEQYRGWTVLNFDARTAELEGPNGIVTVLIKPDTDQLSLENPLSDTEDEDQESSTVREVEEIINANG
ncbi:hypothetical protein [Kordiimonas aquimaris]|uniref:hypothetical protein n=1 Tax=Kordiimonas aquimaris TaxID=707591 RepID=UPI0021D070BB|nr:hypothetical protein [Kordiimonas aquimaris]